MLTLKKREDGVLRLDIAGQIDATEMELGLNNLLEVTNGMSNGHMLYVIKDISIPTLGAIAVELGKLPSLFSLLGRLDKVAVVADQSWVRTVAEWEGALLPGLEIKAFTPDQEAAAEAYLHAA